jgi:nucleotide-binding universal stress UspA family protein
MADMIHHDSRVLACVDQSIYAEYVADCAGWAAHGLSLPLELLHILDRHPERSAGDDHSGALGVEPQDALLRQLVADEGSRNRVAREQGRVFLTALSARLVSGGAPAPSLRQRYGELEDTLVEQQPGVELFVLGRRGESAAGSGRLLGQNFERMVRALQRPILAVCQPFAPPTRALLAFDGGSVTRRGLDLVSRSALFRPLAIDLIMSGPSSRSGAEQLARAATQLRAAGLEVQAHSRPGDPEHEIQRAAQEFGSDLLVMGAYSHSVLRRLFRGSRTSDLLRAVTIPTLLLR